MSFSAHNNNKKTTNTSNEKTYMIKLDKVIAGTSEKIKQGDKIYDNEINSFIGEFLLKQNRNKFCVKKLVFVDLFLIFACGLIL